MQILLSIKPKYVNLIIDGTKTVEFRKTPIRRSVSKAQIYMTRTIKKIVATADIVDIIEDSPEGLWKRFQHVGGISKNDFFEYFSNKTVGYALTLAKIEKLSEEDQITPKHVPQSFCYVS